jgi:hypothetical protein
MATLERAGNFTRFRFVTGLTPLLCGLACTFLTNIPVSEDLLSGGPPGVWTLSFVLTYGLIARYRENFAGLAGLAAVVGFAVAATFACVAAYCIVAALAFITPGAHYPAVGSGIIELAMTVLFYAPAVLVVSWLHHRLVGASRGDV